MRNFVKRTSYLPVSLLKDLRKEANNKYYLVVTPYHKFAIYDDDPKCVSPYLVETYDDITDGKREVDELRRKYIIGRVRKMKGETLKRIY